jgi:hypothetical protein
MLSTVAFRQSWWIRGPECGGPEPVAWGRSPMPLVPVSGGRHDENQRLAGVPAIKQSAGAECGDLRWATEGRGLLRREVRWLASKGGPGGSSRKTGRWLASRGRPVSTWVDRSRSYVAVTNQVSARTGVLPSRASPGGRRLSRSSGATAVRLLAAGAAASLLWGSCGGTLIRFALSTPGGVSPVRAIS